MKYRVDHVRQGDGTEERAIEEALNAAASQGFEYKDAIEVSKYEQSKTGAGYTTSRIYLITENKGI